MHVFIVTDLEGVSCVDSIDMIPKDNEGYQRARALLTADTNAAIDGCFAAGATKVTVLDGHSGGHNLIMELLDRRAEGYSSDDYVKHYKIERYDALMQVGAHAMAGTENAFLDHTQSSSLFFEFRINGVPVGEQAQIALVHGHFGTPYVMVSGDAAACREAEAMVPGIATACVKEAEGRNKAKCLPLEEATERIRQAAMEGVRRCKEIAPCVPQLPAKMELTYTRNDHCDRFMRPDLERHGRTVTKTVEKIEGFLDLIVM